MKLMGERLKTLREQRGLTKEQVAIGTGISKYIYDKLEQGSGRCVSDCLVRLALFYNVKVDYILGLI